MVPKRKLNRKFNRRKYIKNIRKRRSSPVKAECILPSIECNESSKETCYPFTYKKCNLYDDINVNLTPKPLKHPFTKKAQCADLDSSLEQSCNRPLLQNCQSTDENRTQVIENDENMSLIQPSEKSNNSCLSSNKAVKSCSHNTQSSYHTACTILCNNKTACEDNAGSKITSTTDDDSDSDNECLKSHPNRRLLVEKTNYKMLINDTVELQNLNEHSEQLTNDKAEIDILHQTRHALVNEKSYKVSEMWLDILNTPDLWKTETLVTSHLCHKTLNDNSTSNKVIDENTMDFEETVENYMELKEKKSSNNLYEDRFQENLADPDFRSLLADFYITPAKMEILYGKLTSEMSQQECLAQLCNEMQWPQPTYTLVSSKHTSKVLVSCNLKSKIFLPTRPGLSVDLNKELAAFECLNWLGFEQKSDKNANWASKKSVYQETMSRYGSEQ